MAAIDRNFPVVKRIAPRYGSYGFHNPTITVYSLKPDAVPVSETANVSTVTEIDG
jgi:hypothetical protein